MSSSWNSPVKGAQSIKSACAEKKAETGANSLSHPLRSYSEAFPSRKWPKGRRTLYLSSCAKVWCTASLGKYSVKSGEFVQIHGGTVSATCLTRNNNTPLTPYPSIEHLLTLLFSPLVLVRIHRI